MGRPRRRASLALALLSAASFACGSPKRDPEPIANEPPAVPQSEPLVVEHAGCTVSTRTPATCTLRGPERALRLWIDAIEQPAIELDGVARAEPPERVGDELEGWRTTIAVPRGARELTVRTATSSWTMELRDAPATPVLDAIEAKLPKETDPKRSAALVKILDELTAALPKTEGLEQVLLLRLAGIICWDLGRTDDAIAYSRRAITSAIEDDHASVAIEIAQILGHLLSTRPAEVAWLLEMQRLYMSQDGDARRRAGWHYALAYHSFENGEFGSALAELERSEVLSRRIGLVNEELAAVALKVSLLALLGREDHRRRATSRILELADTRAGSNACQDAVALAGAAWSLLLAHASSGTDDDPTRILERVLAYYEPNGGCAPGDNPDWARSPYYAHLYHAVDALMQRDFARLRQRLSWFDDRDGAPELRGWIEYLGAESALADGDPSRALAHLRRVGPDAADPLLSWQAAVLRGRALEAKRDRANALVAYLEAETLLDQVVKNVAIDQGREGLGAGMHEGASRAIGLLLAEGKNEHAARVARLSRSRALRPAGRNAALAGLSATARREYHERLQRYRELSEQIAHELELISTLPRDERVELLRRHKGAREEMHAALVRAYEILARESTAMQELREPGPGEVWLIYHPHDRGWFGFALTSDEIMAADLGPAPRLEPNAEMAAWLLGPFDAAIESSREVHVLAMGALVELPFESLPRANGSLLSERPVAYALDLGTPRPPGGSTRALVVGDPGDGAAGGGALLRARDEALETSTALGRAGYEVETLLGPVATQTALTRSLDRVDWFHYAGHGFSEGMKGWDSALPLAGEARLSVRDVLALPSSPRAVVLSACDTARTDASAAAGGMHLAGAFVIAGATFVIAAHKEVDDELAAAFSAELYKRSTALRVATGPQLLRETLLASEPGPGQRGSPFRVWVP